ncbi:MAG: glycosyltransferase family 2 protein [Candidatus Shapirobacteria bacterium]
MKPLISAVINIIDGEADSLKKCLRSLKNFADEIIIVDMETVNIGGDIAKKFGAKVYPYRFVEYVEPARNYGLSKATGRWIILLDPDEYLSKTLKHELKKITSRSDVDFVHIPRKNIIFGKWFHNSRTWPDYLVRFFKKGYVTWNKEIHSQPQTKGNGVTLLDSEKLAIRHNHYNSVTQYITRALRYSSIQARELESSGIKLKMSDFILKPVQEFNSRFFFAHGYKDGLHGLIFSLLQSFSIFLIYANLWEKQGSPEKIVSKDSFVGASLEASYEYSYWFTKYFKEEYTNNIFKNIFLKFKLLIDRVIKDF